MGGYTDAFECVSGSSGNCEGAYSRKGYWRMARSGALNRALTKERLMRWGFYDLSNAYQSVHVNY